MVYTNNIASWFNRIALALGFQPYGSSPSSRRVLGYLHPLEGIAGTLDHVRIFTLRSLKQLLEVHGFKVEGFQANKVSGFPLSPLVELIDRILSRFPSLSHRVTLYCAKESGTLRH